MKYKDICNKYGTIFYFIEEGSMPQYVVLKPNFNSKNMLANLDTGEVYCNADPVFEKEVSIIRGNEYAKQLYQVGIPS